VLARRFQTSMPQSIEPAALPRCPTEKVGLVTVREQKFEQMISEIYEHEHRVDTLRNIRVPGSAQLEPMSPFAKLHAIAVIHFPQFLPGIHDLYTKASNYTDWVITTAQERSAGKTDELTEGFLEAEQPYREAKKTLLKEMQTFAEQEFGAKPQVKVL
jgi:hypothetical protein